MSTLAMMVLVMSIWWYQSFVGCALAHIYHIFPSCHSPPHYFPPYQVMGFFELFAGSLTFASALARYDVATLTTATYLRARA